MTIYVDSRGLRVQADRPYLHTDGKEYLLSNQATLDLFGITTVPEPETPIGYVEEFYTKEFLLEAPYVVYTRKSDPEIAVIRWGILKRLRDDYTTGNYGCRVEVTPGVVKWFHTDTYSKMQQMSLETSALMLRIAGGLDEDLLIPQPWKTMDGTYVPMTLGLAMKVAAAQKTRDVTLFMVAETKNQDGSNPYTGWPEVFVP